MISNKNQTLELLKLLASYMVVFIHVPFYGKIGTAMNALARFAVPLFFLISGFYSYNTSHIKIKKRIVHIIHLLAFSTILYTVYNAVLFLYNNDLEGLFQYFNKYLNLKAMLKLLMLNVPVHATHLWYLLALIYVYFIAYFTFKYKLNEKFIFIASFSLLTIHLFMGEFLSTLGYKTPIILVRNFALFGMPFFGIGMLVKKYENLLRKIPSSVIFISAITGISETLFSRLLFGTNELYIGSMLILFAIIIIFIKYDDKKYPPLLSSLDGCGTYIYILHILLSSFILRLYQLGGLNYNSSITMRIIHPLFICFLSTILAYCIKKLMHKFRIKI